MVCQLEAVECSCSVCSVSPSAFLWGKVSQVRPSLPWLRRFARLAARREENAQFHLNPTLQHPSHEYDICVILGHEQGIFFTSFPVSARVLLRMSNISCFIKSYDSQISFPSPLRVVPTYKREFGPVFMTVSPWPITASH